MKKNIFHALITKVSPEDVFIATVSFNVSIIRFRYSCVMFQALPNQQGQVMLQLALLVLIGSQDKATR